MAVFWKGKRGGGGQPLASLFFSFSFFFFFLFPFSFLCVQCFSTKRNETNRNEMKLCGSYSSFMNDLDMSPKKENSDNLYIRNSTSFIDIIFDNSLLRLRVTGKLYPWTCKLSLSFFISLPCSSDVDEKSKRGGGIIINGKWNETNLGIYIYIYICRYLQMVL